MAMVMTMRPQLQAGEVENGIGRVICGSEQFASLDIIGAAAGADSYSSDTSGSPCQSYDGPGSDEIRSGPSSRQSSLSAGAFGAQGQSMIDPMAFFSGEEEFNFQPPTELYPPRSPGNPNEYYSAIMNSGGGILYQEDEDENSAASTIAMMGGNASTLMDQWGNPMHGGTAAAAGVVLSGGSEFMAYVEERGGLLGNDNNNNHNDDNNNNNDNCNNDSPSTGLASQQSSDMDDQSAIESWMDLMVNELAESMPEVPVDQLLQSLSETFAPSGNFQAARLMRSYGPSSTNDQFQQRSQSPVSDMTSLSDQSVSSRGSKRSRDTSPGSWDSDEMIAHEQERLFNHTTMMRNQHEQDFGHQQQNQQQLIQQQEQEQRQQLQMMSQFTAKDEEGFEILAQLLQCAEALSADNFEEANEILPQLHELASPYGSPIQRVAAYFAEAMASRLLNSCIGMCSPLRKEQLLGTQGTQAMVAAFQVFNGICPFVKFSHFTANQAILEAFEGEDSVHIIDVDIMEGLQWSELFHILAVRPGGPPRVRITGLGTSMEALEATGRRLSNFAQGLGLPFQYTPVADRIGNVDARTLRVRKGEALAVHWLHHSLYDVTGSDTRTLQLLRSLSPKVVTIIEQDLSFSGSFLNRFVEALHYYSALFDSLGASFPDDHPKRHTVEQQLLSCEIKNILAVGGPARTTEVKLEQWRDQLGAAGFKPVSLSGNAAIQASLLLGMFQCEGYTLVKQNGTLKLGWKDLCLFTASAWKA
ncbi:unnamed protein product [Calypogeia fissa]